MTPRSASARFFIQPESTAQRQYELLRGRFVEGQSIRALAQMFGYKEASAYSLVYQFKAHLEQGNPPAFFVTPKTGPKTERKKTDIREHVIRLRARDYASTDILKALRAAGFSVSLSLIDQVLREEGLTSMTKRTGQQRRAIADEIADRQAPGLDIPNLESPVRPDQSNVRKLCLRTDQPLLCPAAGVFLFLPFLANIGFHDMIHRAQWPGSKMIPAVSYGLNALYLKLMARERKSHITEWGCDPSAGLFVGLNVPPKKQATTDYSYRLSPQHHDAFLAAWTQALYPQLCPQGTVEFALDAHAIAYRGREDLLETHYVPTQGKKAPAIISFFARAVNRPFLCYAKADLRKEALPDLPLRFADYWQSLMGVDPQWLYFDSRTTTYQGLRQLNARKISFITVRRKGLRMLETIDQTPAALWNSTTIPTAKYPHTHIHYLDQIISLKGYEGPIRQIAQRRRKGLTSLFLTNNTSATARDILTRYHQRNYIENEIGVNVNFFHMDCLSSEVALNVSFDILMTLAANGCYRWLSRKVKGYEKMEPKKLFRMIVNTPGHITVDDDHVHVCLDRRAHNPLVRQAIESDEPTKIPWINNKPLLFSFK